MQRKHHDQRFTRRAWQPSPKNSVIHERRSPWASGRESDFYVDMRRSTLHHEWLRSSATSCPTSWRRLASRWASTWPSADRWVLDPCRDQVMLHAAASRGLDLTFVVRKAAKDYGMKRRIEGPDVANVVVLEDTSTTGGFPPAPQFVLRGRWRERRRRRGDRRPRDAGASGAIEAEGFPYFYALGLRTPAWL